MTIRFGQPPLQDEQGLDEYGLAFGGAQRVDGAGPVGDIAIDRASHKETNNRAEESQQPIAYDDTDEFEQNRSCMTR